MINIGQYIEMAINWMMVHFSTFFDRGKGNGFLRMKTFHTVYSFVHFWNKLA